MDWLPVRRIRRKIIVPFVALFMAATVIVAYVSDSLVSRVLENALEGRIARASELVSSGQLALNPAILENLKLAIGVEIVTYRPDGSILASTLDAGSGGALAERARSAAGFEALLAGDEDLVLEQIEVDGLPYRIATSRVAREPETLVALIFPTSGMAETKAVVRRAIAIVAILTAISMSILGAAIAHNITSPIDELVAFTRRIAAGDLNAKAAVETRDELATLAAAFNDMVDRLKASEAELLHSEKLAVTGQLAARVAHDVRNPLSSIKMQAQLLRQKLQPGQANQHSLAAILDEVDRVERVVGGLLDLSRPAELDLQLGDVSAIADAAVRSAESGLAHRKIAIRCSLAADLPKIPIDAHRMQRALLNLIANAADAMPDGGTIAVSTRLRPDEDAVEIEVIDDGTGIDPAARDRIFDPFFTTRREGVGLGLVNTKSIVERHGGRITLQPGSERGTRALITLPCVASERIAARESGE